MSEERIALAVIAGDSAIEEGFERMLRSVAGKVHGVFVAYTGTGDHDRELFSIMDPEIFPEGCVCPVGWSDNFALARNQSFDLVYEHMEAHKADPDSQFDWIIWLDCDDVIPEHVDLQAQIKILRKKRAHGAFVNYNYSLDPKTGVVFVSHMKERMFRTDVSWNWTWPIHESCHGPIATRMAQLDPAEFSVNHLRNDVSRRPRNRAIIERWYMQDENNLRAKMMMAHELKAEAEGLPSSPERHAALNAALVLYRDFIAVSDPDDDSFACNRYVADILMQLGRINDSINIDLQGVKMQPTWPASYVGIAETLYRSGDFEGAIQWADVTLRACEVPKTLHVFNNLDLNYRPLMFKAAALRKLGRFDEALQIYRDEASQYLHDQHLEDQITETYREAQANKIGSNEEAVRAIHDLNWGKQPEKSIAFFLTPHVEPWNPETLKKSGLGGTETCVIKLAEELGSRGWRVVIYGEPGNWNGRIANNVEWYHSSYFHPDQPFTAVVGVRFPPIFDAKVNAEVKLLWLHDVNVGDIRYDGDFDRFAEIDAVITPSDWHALHTRRVYGNFSAQSVAITNGFDRELFRYSEDDAQRRDPNRMVYASSPDRGLERLLDLWPKIREQMPNAWLEIFYGWDTIDAIINDGAAHGPQLMAFKKRILTMIENLGGKEGGIFWRGRVGQETLSVSLRKASVMPYPANFCVTGDTPIDCPRDHERFPEGVPISMIEPGRLIWTINEQTHKFELKPIKRVWKSKVNAPIYALTLDSGKVIRATADHRFMRRDGSWAELRELNVGDSLMPLYRDAEPMIKLDPNRRAGWSVEYREVAKHLFGDDRKGRHTHHVDERHFNNTPENLQDLSPEEHFSITHKGKKHGSSTKKAMSAAQQARFAAMTDEERREMAARTNGCDRSAAAKKAWETKRKKQALLALQDNPFYNHKIAAIEPAGYEDVWDMEVEGNHNFVVNGVVLHNCETFGIVFAQAMTAGCIPVVPNLGALPDLVQDRHLVIDGAPDSEDFGQRFVDAVVREAQTTDGFFRRELAHRTEPYVWSNVTDAWEAQIAEHIANNRSVVA